MALFAAVCHSCDKVTVGEENYATGRQTTNKAGRGLEERESHDAPWRQKHPPLVKRPAPLCACCVAGLAWRLRLRLGEPPSLELPRLAAPATEALDASALSCVLQKLMREHECEEEEEEEEE